MDRPAPDPSTSGLDLGWRDPRYDAALEELVVLQVEQGRVFARQARVLALLASRTSREGWQGVAPFESLQTDVAGSCLLGQVAAGSRLLDAEHLVVRLPTPSALWRQGSCGSTRCRCSSSRPAT